MELRSGHTNYPVCYQYYSADGWQKPKFMSSSHVIRLSCVEARNFFLKNPVVCAMNLEPSFPQKT